MHGRTLRFSPWFIERERETLTQNMEKGINSRISAMKLRGFDLLMYVSEDTEASLDAVAGLAHMGNATTLEREILLWAFEALCAEKRKDGAVPGMLPRVLTMMEAPDSPLWLLDETLFMLKRAIRGGVFPDKSSVVASRLWVSVLEVVKRLTHDPVVFPRDRSRVRFLDSAAGVFALLQTSSVVVPCDVVDAVFECFKHVMPVVYSWMCYVKRARSCGIDLSVFAEALPGVAAALESNRGRGSEGVCTRELSSFYRELQEAATKSQASSVLRED
jgi:hypothetical protein